MLNDAGIKEGIEEIFLEQSLQHLTKTDDESKNWDKQIEEKYTKLIESNKTTLNAEEFDLESFDFTGCIHENISPKGKGTKLVKATTEPPKEYEFVLDKFQERALLCLENGQSVLVSAHTSAGKTVVAQYAIAMALRDRQRVIYTSPIKALSNQKYRELQNEFKDVGLMTGDVTINPNASCLVMTTEILRNMLYKGSEITREMAWVIFDEVHYMRDKERGVVWEETMILLPNVVKYVFLSATIPNAREFAQWICKIKNQPCNVVYTDYRPVPLQHYVYTPGSEGIYLVVDEKGNFREENFSLALSNITNEIDVIFDKNNKHKKKQGAEADIKKIITLIKENSLDPAIIFSFSKAECEKLAMSLSKMDLTTEQEKENIELIFKNAIGTLSEEDQSLPQIQMIFPLLMKGIGIHHGGLMPIVKESVELIFQEGYLKALFSTETFSMGINMPAKTVVFTALEKWDGEEHRWLTGGEYIQMSGRAGRRGLDDRGITILMLNKKMDEDVCRNMMNGKSDPLFSTFHLSYNMIVNLMRVEGIKPDYIVKRSFHQFQSERALPQINNKIKELYNQYKTEFRLLSQDIENTLRTKISLEMQIERYQEELSQIIVRPENILKFLVPGRIVKIKDWGWGICVNYTKKKIELTFKSEKNKQYFGNLLSNTKTKDPNSQTSNNEASELTDKTYDVYFVDTLLYVKKVVDADKKLLPGNIDANDGQFGVVPVVLNSFENLSSVVVKVPKDMKDKNNLKLVEKIYFEVMKRFKGKPALVDPVKDMAISDKKVEELLYKIKNLQTKLEEFENLKKTDMINSETMVDLYKQKEKLRNNLISLFESANKLKEVVLKNDLKYMRRVLRKLELTSEDTVLQKGQVACIITSADELLITEMIFNGSFNDLEPNQLVALLSCFMANEGGSKEEQKKNTKNTQMMDNLHKIIKENAEKIADVLIESKLQIDKSEYRDSFKNTLMEISYEWANGAKFSDLFKISDVYEGTIIRALRRLDELIRQLIEACQFIGNTSLKEKLTKASELIRRGIVFAASLYLNA
jgi:ATP-dependent RNA helicase DOB1